MRKKIREDAGLKDGRSGMQKIAMSVIVDVCMTVENGLITGVGPEGYDETL